MEFYRNEYPEDALESECPVCYEFLSGKERTLSCGHIFCHDCLVKTLVSLNRDGIIKGTIICPICRHLTFIKEKNDTEVSLATGKDVEQTLEVPITSPPNAENSVGASRHDLLRGFNRISHYIREISSRCSRQTLVNPGQKVSQIFIISAQGRPMAEEDVVNVVMTVVRPHRRQRRRICTISCCLVILLSAFTVLALVAATLPWILLA
ncbi:RING finger protein 222 [Aplochiton taeniatus]